MVVIACSAAAAAAATVAASTSAQRTQLMTKALSGELGTYCRRNPFRRVSPCGLLGEKFALEQCNEQGKAI
jgi:hypothetical protein